MSSLFTLFLDFLKKYFTGIFDKLLKSIKMITKREEAKVKRPRILRFLIVLWLVILTLWLWQGAIYSHTLYEIKQTGEAVERYSDRGAGLEVEAIPIYEPDNPLWVDITRSVAPILLFLLPCYIIAIEFDFREKRKEARVPLAKTKKNPSLP